MEAWFVSDIHLKSQTERSGEILLRFLHSLASGERHATHLFLVGDIFDLWIADHQYFAQKFSAIVSAVEALKRQGVEIVYFEGNHDLHLKKFWEDVLGARVFVNPQYFKLGARTVRVEHGDLINMEDKAYLRLRGFLRSGVMAQLAHLLPGKLIGAIGEAASRESRKHSSSYRENKDEQLKQMIRHHARRSYQQDTPFDVIISGHMHVHDDEEFEVDGHRIRSINLGSWFGEIKALHLTDTNIEWITL